MQDCIFCKIVAGDMPSHKVYEDDRAFAFLDIHPVNPGHTLVIPKAHAPTIFDIAEADWLAVTAAMHKVAPAIDAALDADGINVVMNNREDAGQVIHHAHVHLIPRFKGDGLKPWPHKTYKEGEAEEVLSKVRAKL